MIKATYVNHMGDDLSVVNAARVSFNKKSDWVCAECGDTSWVHDYDYEYYCGKCRIGDYLTLSGRDKKLIKYLAKHEHFSPFNHCFATFHVKAPVFVARQLVKHEYMPWNEVSRRYVDDEPEFYTPEVWRGRSEDKKQGSEGMIELEKDWDDSCYIPENINAECLATYQHLLSVGTAPEQARMVLPQSLMTEWYWSGSLGAFAKMCRLRLKPDAQYETRIVAEQISDKMLELYPVSWGALNVTNTS